MLNLVHIPLHAGRGWIQAASALLEFGADCNAATTSGDTPLHVAAQRRWLAMVDKFLDAGWGGATSLTLA